MKLAFLHPNWVSLSRIMVSLQEQIRKDFEIINILHSPYIKDFSNPKQPCYVFMEYFYDRKKKRSSSRIELQAWEKRIDFPLMEVLYADIERHSSYSNYRKIYEEILLAYIEFFDDIFQKEKLDFIISEPVANAFLFLAYLIGRLYNISYRGIESARFPNRFGIVEDVYGYNRQRTELFEKGTPTLNQESLNYLSRLEVMQPDYTKGQDRLPQLIKKKMIQKAIPYIICNIKYYKYNRIDPGAGTSFSNQLHFTKRKIKKIFNWYATKSKGVYKRPNTESEQDYFLFPLQYQPEASTLVLAPHFTNQYEVIRNIAISLPVGIRLYVKEHRSFLGTRGLKFYKKVLTFPNVELVDPFINTVKLIKKSLGVVTITSTVGYEALLLNKPVICFGNVFYDFHPLCLKVTAYPELKKVLRNIADGKIEVDPSWPSRFLYAYYETTWPGTFDYMNPNSFLPENIEKISKGLKSTLFRDSIERC